MSIKKLKKMNKGITLIALVITIIVLLILAAVAISTLTGENGVLTKSNIAKEQNEIKKVIEETQIEILGIQADNEGKITKTQFRNILEKYFIGTTIPKENELPDNMMTATQNIITKEEYGSYTIKISDIWNGKFTSAESVTEFKPETLTIGTPENTNKYGWKVENYTVKTEEYTTGIWRLFFQDSQYTYLIVDECVGDYKLSDKLKNYSSGKEVSMVGQKLNVGVKSFFIEENTEENVRATAWLTDQEVWKNYRNQDAVLAIGSPTVELLAASYNNTEKENQIYVGTGEKGYKHAAGERLAKCGL